MSIVIWGGLGLCAGFFLHAVVAILFLLWEPDDPQPLRRRGAVIRLRRHRPGPPRFWIGVTAVGAVTALGVTLVVRGGLPLPHLSTDWDFAALVVGGVMGVFYRPGMNP